MKEITTITTTTEAPSSNTTLYIEDEGGFKRASIEHMKEALGINAETERAEEAEGNIESSMSLFSDGLVAEIERAQATEAALSDAIAAEISRAEDAEKVLTESLTSETERATTAEGVNTAAITAETERATAEEALKVNKTELFDLLFTTVSVIDAS